MSNMQSPPPTGELTALLQGNGTTTTTSLNLKPADDFSSSYNKKRGGEALNQLTGAGSESRLFSSCLLTAPCCTALGWIRFHHQSIPTRQPEIQ